MVSDPRQIPEQDRWRIYEAEKQTWMALHPEATADEYEIAIRRIAEECGV